VQAANRLASHRFNKYNGGKAARLFYYTGIYYNIFIWKNKDVFEFFKANCPNEIANNNFR
jgi:hypothetical protein